MSKHIPQVGDKYYPLFESDWRNGEPTLTIKEIYQDYEDGGFAIFASDDIGYDCYWSEKLQMWCYSLK